MPSEVAERPRGWLFSQGLGFLCGQATVLLLGAGSVVIVQTRDGVSAGVQLDDLTAFFRPLSWVHAWFYALTAVLFLYALNTALCTWVSVVSKWRQGIRQVSAYAPPVIHVSFLVALLAHGVGGLWNAEREPLILSSSWQELGGGRQARLADLATESLPDGKTKSVQAKVDVRGADGAVAQHVIGYNEPLSRGLGLELFLLSQAGQTPGAARISSRTSSCTLAIGASCELDGVVVKLLGVQGEERPMAAVSVIERGQPPRQVLLPERMERQFSTGVLRFDGAIGEPAIALRVRSAPGNPIALLSAILLAVGLGMMGRRWLMT